MGFYGRGRYPIPYYSINLELSGDPVGVCISELGGVRMPHEGPKEFTSFYQAPKL